MTLRCLTARVVAGDVVKMVKIAKIVNIGLVLFSFFVAFFFFLLIGAISSTGRAASASASERTRSGVAVKRPGTFWLVAAFAWSLATFSTAPRAVVAQTPSERESLRPAQSVQTTQSARRLRPSRQAQTAQPSRLFQSSRPAQPSQSAQSSQSTQSAKPARSEDATAASSRRFDPLRRDALGVQTRYPAVAKIVGRDAPQAREDGSQTIPLYYGTGTLVAEVGEWGIVLSNWHVVSEARDSIVVKFPTFSSPARVILRDEVWDLAALLVRKPPRVAPIPISQEVPGVGDALWVAGYGKSAGLTEFQIQGGRVQNYALLVTTDEESKEPSAAPAEGAASGAGKSGATFAQDGQFGQTGRSKRGGLTNGLASGAAALTATPEDAFFYETLAVDKGVREGDSGGPIFNRYGELAGVLWGSNGESTMGTYCIRAQFFLTQAIGRLATLEATRRLERPDAPSDELLTWRAEEGVPDATGTEIWARTALEASGVHPIAQRPAYVAADGRETPENLLRLDVDSALKRVRTALTVAENSTTTALPPSPPVFSPTFVSQQRLQNCVRPEVAEADFWTTLTDAELTKLAAKRAPESTQVRETSVIDESETSVRLAYAAGKNGGAKSLGGNAGNDDKPENWSRPSKSARPESDATLTTDGADDRTPARWRPVGFDGENGESSGNSEKSRRGEDGESGENSESRARDENSGSGEDGESGESAANVGEERETESGANREDAENKENGEDAVNRENSEDGKTAEDNVDAKGKKESSGADEPRVKKEKEEKRVKFNGVYLNDFQVYLIVCMIFCLFYNAARLMTEADVKKERQKRQKTRRIKEID